MDKEYISTWNVVSWYNLVTTLPDKYQKIEIINQLKYWYHAEVTTIIEYVKKLQELGKPYHAFMSEIDVNPGSSQMIVNFSVKDLTKKDDPRQVNFHLQNTSQWVYAGAIVIDKRAIERGDERVVSTHH